jgi:flagellar biosynthetic protein FlhB
MLAELEMMRMFSAACALVYALAVKLAVILLLLAFLDWAYQRWQRERDLRMSKQEIKEEYKRMEGDPLIKQRRARVARQLAMQRISQAVPKADVIVTNPTHFSIALQYDPKTMKSPKVVAKGADFMAMRIRQIAAIHGIPLVERKPLAQALYKSVEVGQEVPSQFYAAVAEVLAYVYRLSGRKTA